MKVAGHLGIKAYLLSNFVKNCSATYSTPAQQFMVYNSPWCRLT